MTQPYESSDGMNTLDEKTYKQIEQALEDQIEYWGDQQAVVALGQFLEGNREGAEELERIETEIFMGESLKTILKASVGEPVNTENAVQMVRGYIQKNNYRV